MGPLYKFGWFDYAYALQLAVLIGFLFGFVLERAGFGNARKLTAIFYLRDFAVLKVMFTAIVVCMLGLLYFSVFGWIDLGRVYLLQTNIWPQIVAGLLLGVGFVMGGYCPTTSVVATVSGKLDGLVFLGGMVIGSVIFAELFPLLAGFYEAGAMGAVTLSDVLGIHSGIVALGACLMAVGAFWLGESLEGRFGDPARLPGGSRRMKLGGAALLVGLGLILAVVNPDRFVSSRPEAQPEAESVEATPRPESAPAAGSDAAAPVPRPAEPPAPAPGGFRILHDEGC